jgi:hypothetical protein
MQLVFKYRTRLYINLAQDATTPHPRHCLLIATMATLLPAAIRHLETPSGNYAHTHVTLVLESTCHLIIINSSSETEIDHVVSVLEAAFGNGSFLPYDGVSE